MSSRSYTRRAESDTAPVPQEGRGGARVDLIPHQGVTTGKRIALRAASLGLVAAGAVGLSCATAFAASNIEEGDTGAGVVCVQRAMNILDGAGLATDGDFGQLTYDAVVTYHGDHDLQKDGQVGPLVTFCRRQFEGADISA